MDDLRKTVSDLIASLSAQGVTMPNGLAELAQRTGVLPMSWDMGGVIALSPDGEIVSWAWEDEDRRSTSHHSIERHVVMFQGAAKYPRLRPFLPHRTPDSQVCQSCRGSGRPLGIPDAIPSIVCACGGAGWLPASPDNV